MLRSASLPLSPTHDYNATILATESGVYFMATALAPARRKKRRTRAAENGRRPTWELLRYLPHQGDWTEDEYLALEGRLGDHIRVELSDGNLEVPAAIEPHQLLMLYFVRCLDAFAQKHAPGL